MKQTTFDTAANPYESAFVAQGQIAAIDMQIRELSGQKTRLEEACKASIAEGEPTGKAGQYKWRYIKFLESLMDRIMDALPLEYDVCEGKVGPNGGFGYYLSH